MDCPDSFDVYVNPSKKITVCGIEEWCQASPLLFTWEELENLQVCELRLSEGGIAGVAEEIAFENEGLSLDQLVQEFNRTKNDVSDSSDEDR
jgi:hypothetical protein